MVRYLLLNNENEYNQLQTLLLSVHNYQEGQKVFNGWQGSLYYIMQIDTNYKIPINHTQWFVALKQYVTPLMSSEDLLNLENESNNSGYIRLDLLPNLRDYEFMISNGFISE